MSKTIRICVIARIVAITIVWIIMRKAGTGAKYPNKIPTIKKSFPTKINAVPFHIFIITMHVPIAVNYPSMTSIGKPIVHMLTCIENRSIIKKTIPNIVIHIITDICPSMMLNPLKTITFQCIYDIRIISP